MHSSEKKLNINDINQLVKVGKALDTEIKVNIIRLLSAKSMSINEIAQELKIPNSTAGFNIKALEDVGFIKSEQQPGLHGQTKMCTQLCKSLTIDLNPIRTASDYNFVSYNIPIGSYTDCKVSAPCGFATRDGFVSLEFDESIFYLPERINAQIIWITDGWFEYRFPNSDIKNNLLNSIEISAELCSEAPNYKNDWPSDITMWINGVDVGKWICPGDFGGRRGSLNPEWWPDAATQHGILKMWKVTQLGTYIDNDKISSITVGDLNLKDKEYVSVKIGIKSGTENIRGMNIFGNGFGDYEQDIRVKMDFKK
jgi:predicted transcriptional regulator